MGPFHLCFHRSPAYALCPYEEPGGLKEWFEWFHQPHLELCYTIVIFHRPKSQEEMSSPKTKEAPLPDDRTGSKRIYHVIKSPLCQDVWVDGRGGRERERKNMIINFCCRGSF